MKRTLEIVTALLLVNVLSAQTNLLPDTEDGDFFFKMPSGWRQTRTGGLFTLLAPPAHQGTETSIGLITANLASDLRSTFDQAWETFPFKIQPGGQAVPQVLASGNEAMTRGGAATDAAGRPFAFLFIVARNQDRTERILFTTNDLDAQAYAASIRALTTFLASLRFKYAGLPAAAPSAPAPNSPPPVSVAQSGMSGIAGLYRAKALPGIDTTAGLDLFDPARKTPDFVFLSIFPDGRVKKGLINMGFDDYVVDSSFRHDVANGGAIAAKWGQYAVGGGQGRIVFAHPTLAGQQLISGLRGEMWQFTQQPGRLDIQGLSYYLLDSGRGLSLDGVFKPYGDTTQPGIRFTRDGLFTDEGILDTHSSTAVGVAGGGVGMAYGFDSPHAGRGSYRIANYGLHMNYSNGKFPNPLFYLEPGSPRDNVHAIYINNVRYQRVQ